MADGAEMDVIAACVIGGVSLNGGQGSALGVLLGALTIAINRKWWDYMADIMETNPDNSPVAVDLQNVFHLD